MEKQQEFQLPLPPVWQDHESLFDQICASEGVRPVNHGEFEAATNAVLLASKARDLGARKRVKTLATQRCRRGGKTFMLRAVAASLCKGGHLEQGTNVIYISLNDTSTYIPTENADDAILSRVAFALSGETDFGLFAYKYYKEGFSWVQVYTFIVESNLVLLIDELNKIPPEAPNYAEMSRFLSNMQGRRGSAVLYTTHKRDTVDLLRGRDEATESGLSSRDHLWQSLPRIENEICLQGMVTEGSEQLSLWCAVLRGRIPSLLLLDSTDISRFALSVFRQYKPEVGHSKATQIAFESSQMDARVQALKAVISGNLDNLPRDRNAFSSYSYMCPTDAAGVEPRYAWPPFMVTQKNVLGKDYPQLRALMESPQTSESKAFEALVELSVLVRLLSNEHHALVPRNPAIVAGDDYMATELFYVGKTNDVLDTLINAVRVEFSSEAGANVLQVVAVPMHDDFPKYDFFLLHRQSGNDWVVAAGYQCKLTRQTPDENHEAESTTKVPLSVWIEGSCSERRLAMDPATAKRRAVDETMSHGWHLLGAQKQDDLLGCSVAEALPGRTVDVVDATYSKLCLAEVAYHEHHNRAFAAE